MRKHIFKILTFIFAGILFFTFASKQAVQAKTTTQTVMMRVYKYTKNHRGRAKSIAQSFIGTKAQVVLDNNKVSKLVIHVNGNNNALGKNRDVASIVKSLKINGVKSTKANISKDRSNFDFVFGKNAFKNNGWAKLNVVINFGSQFSEQAWIKFGKLKQVASKKRVVKRTKKQNRVKNKKTSKVKSRRVQHQKHRRR